MTADCPRRRRFEKLDPDDLDLRGILRDGDVVVVGQMAGEPLALTEALVRQRSALPDLTIFIGVQHSPTFDPSKCDGLKFTSFGAMDQAALLARAGRLRIVPASLSRLGAYFDQGAMQCDVAMVMLSPPGPDGRMSFGVTNDYMREAMGRARVVVAEINDQMPWTFGDGGVDPSEIDYAVHTSRPLPQRTGRQPTSEDERIAANVASFIEDGATLQAGIGNVPDAVLASLADRRALGFHSGLMGDGAAELMQRGVITNSVKERDAGVSVAALLSGTDRLYRFADRNPAIRVRSSGYTNSARTLAGFDRLVAINSAIEIDLGGAANAETIGDRYVGGTGGLMDFVRAGQESPNGRSIIALPSTGNGGRDSRIVSRLNGPVTVPRSDADIVVTEHGVAELRGRSLSERARLLTAIAAPAFREALERDARAVGVW